MEEVKRCSRCGHSFPATTEFFHKDPYKKDGLCYECKVCKSETMRKVRYGIGDEEYDELLEGQDGICPICKKTEAETRRDRFDIDHNHESGEIRGLICNRCNKMIGMSGDDPEMLIQGAVYLIKGGKKT